MSFDAKSGILKAINETADASLRTVLLLMLAVFEELGGKLDNVLQNEDSLRHTVLNGHAANHHRDHEWLDRRIQRDAQIEVIVGWAESKIIKERQDEEDARKVKVDVVGKVFGYLAVAAVTAFLTYLGTR